MKTKVLYVVSSLRSCGPVNQLLGIVSNLDQQQFDFKVLTLSPEPQNTRRPDFVEKNIPLDSLNLSRVKFALTGKKALKEYIDQFAPDVIHTTGVRVDTTIANLGYGDKQVMSIRNYAYEDYVAKFGKLAGTYFADNTIKAIDKAAYPVCCAYSLKEMYDKHSNRELNVIQNGVDTKKYAPLEPNTNINELRTSLNLPVDKNIVIVVGSLIKRKNPLTIIEAFHKADRKDAVLVFLGEGDLKEECQEKAGENVLFKGNVPNVVEYLQASDLYISSSLSEGLPNSVLEAGRTDIPMILSDIPQHREVFMHGYVFDNFFSPNDASTLSSLINTELDKESESESISGYISAHFSTPAMSAQYQKLYTMINK